MQSLPERTECQAGTLSLALDIVDIELGIARQGAGTRGTQAEDSALCGGHSVGWVSAVFFYPSGGWDRRCSSPSASFAQMNAFSDFSLFGTGVSACTGSGGRRSAKLMIYLGGEISEAESRFN